jgi:hypothetical protein
VLLGLSATTTVVDAASLFLRYEGTLADRLAPKP